MRFRKKKLAWHLMIRVKIGLSLDLTQEESNDLYRKFLPCSEATLKQLCREIDSYWSRHDVDTECVYLFRDTCRGVYRVTCGS